jgi:hypothetical protein
MSMVLSARLMMLAIRGLCQQQAALLSVAVVLVPEVMCSVADSV